MPFRSASPLLEPAGLAPLRLRPGLAKLRTTAGDTGWLVTRRADLRKLGMDPRIGRSHADPDHAPRLWDAALFTPQANFDTEVEDHRRWRRAVSHRFGASRIDALRPQAGRLCAGLLDAMVAEGAPADLHAALADPFASRLNFDVLGIPPEDHDRMRALSDDLRTDDRDRATTAHAFFVRYLTDLLAHKRRHPGDDALSDLATARDSDGPLTPAQAFEGAYQLYFGGYETLAARISLGVLALLTHPDQYEALATGRAPASGAVEEILRFAVPGGSWIPRYALADIDHHGDRIRAGDLVVFCVQSANRDESAFTDADRFDITREPNPHVGFGHGNFHCAGASLARLGLSAILGSLPPHLPRLRLHTSRTAPTTHDGKVTGGLHALPVTW
ncbi:cytochrome P450 [Streptomyces sp. NBC_01317]|uniref:cytochrome P450 n=1 Tax=Streptomyces sp. NBC_01317 TaxID=2903822 RepID=UPI002E115F08|nr:cytochrome P450 [Streptomyces sp. NBC_01317]